MDRNLVNDKGGDKKFKYIEGRLFGSLQGQPLGIVIK